MAMRRLTLGVGKALSFWIEWRQAQPMGNRQGNARSRDKRVWIPPAVGQWKLNVDAAIMGEAGCGMGIVIRDHTGSVERVGVQQVRDRWNPDIAEAMAAGFGLRTAVQMGLDNVVLESDCLALITMLKSKFFPTNYFGRMGKVVSDLASNFSCISFNFTHREGNYVAHELAHLLPIDYSTRYWVGSIPERVEPFVELDALDLPG
ncbi:uncharacterized protein LOC141614639 [Silene latifolia]|uniref:uncharacterized protein LOC141614639 n=1 Tax=Silene latifolia TaxID=37657 RepID=UPI003D76F552